MKKEHHTVVCADGFKLRATLYKGSTVKAGVLLAPATGIRRTFYDLFSSHLADSGFATITFDYRGIGDSRNEAVTQSTASLIKWGQLDMTAVLDHLQEVLPGQTYHLIGHSAGGQLVGLMKNAGALKSCFNVACSSGSLRNMDYPFRVKAIFFMNFFIPVTNLLLGYTPSTWLGMGEPLPKKVAAQWSRWCNGKGYVKVDLGRTIKDHSYDELDIPALWLHITDDNIATITNVRDMIRVYSKMDAKVISLDPKEHGFDEIGHMKFFSPHKKELWKYAIDWLEKYSK